MRISEATLANGFRAITLENEFVRLICLPDFGGKITSLFDVKNNYEWLEQGPLPTSLEQYKVGDTWTGQVGWGWDECFPNINAEDGYTAPLVDHGELWSRPWRFDSDQTALTGTVEGHFFDFTFERRLSLQTNKVIARYKVTNRMPGPFVITWAMHSVFAAVPGMRIELPESLTQLQVETPAPPTPNTLVDWPVTTAYDNRALDLSLTPPVGGFPSAFKLLAAPQNPADGWAVFHGPQGQLKVEFDPAKTPVLGLWLNYGHWENMYHVAIEPSIGNSGSLTRSAAQNTAVTIPAGSDYTWEVEWSLLNN